MQEDLCPMKLRRPLEKSFKTKLKNLISSEDI